MEDLKELFGEEGIKYDDFVKKVNEKGIKLVDLSKGEYVGKKKYDDEIAQANTKFTDLEKKYNELNSSIKTGDDGMQKKYDDLLANYNDLKTQQEANANKITTFERKEAIRNAGITNDRLVDLALYELKDSKDFNTDIKTWADSNKNLMSNVKTMPSMNGNPDGKTPEEEGEKKFFSSFYKASGVDEKDLESKK